MVLKFANTVLAFLPLYLATLNKSLRKTKLLDDQLIRWKDTQKGTVFQHLPFRKCVGFLLFLHQISILEFI